MVGRHRVLNAFRHHCCHHIDLGNLVWLSNRCSTPFGITAVITICPDVFHQPGAGCSTPFGITAVITVGLLERTLFDGSVLNAFRHHCCHHTFTAAKLGYSTPCSTPFGITAVITAAVAMWREKHGVLNAFRHHCCHHTMAEIKSLSLAKCSTPFGITAVITIACSWMLDHAICAQRLSASLLSSRRDSGANGPHHRVLNAFRHHCCHHSRGHVRAVIYIVCSTPFGITAVIIAANWSVIELTSSAQRLSASLLSSRGIILSTMPLGTSAQRLSASLLSSQGA